MSFFGKSRQTEAQAHFEESAATRPDVVQSSAPPSPVGFETVLGANSTLEGTLRSKNNVRLDGLFSGTLEITGNVLVGETAKITADINARNISIAGAVRGNVTGRKVQLLRTGRIWGDIRAQALTTEEGAFIDGKITMISDDATAIAPRFDEPEVQPAVDGEERVIAALTSPLVDPEIEAAEEKMVSEGGHDFAGGATENDGPPPVEDELNT